MPDVHLVDERDDVALDCAAGAVEVLLVGWSLAAGEALANELRLRGVPARPVSEAVLPTLAADGGATVLALGPALSPSAALDILREVTHADWPGRWVLLGLAAGERVEVFQELIDCDRLFFVANPPPPCLKSSTSSSRHRRGPGRLHSTTMTITMTRGRPR